MNGKKIYPLGQKRELFVDDFFIDRLDGAVTRRLHEPVPDDLILTLDEPHEMTNNAGGSYNSLLWDGKRYLYYYRAHGRFPTPAWEGTDDFYLCAAESEDGIHFRRCRVIPSPISICSTATGSRSSRTGTARLLPICRRENTGSARK